MLMGSGKQTLTIPLDVLYDSSLKFLTLIGLDVMVRARED